MNQAMIHRGPDDEGIWTNESIAIAMRRLSIIDLSGGHQPIFNEDKSLLIVMNGELYNYRELRADLERRGHRFSTRSDVEVVLHLYEEHGERTPAMLKGMFAFCIANTRDQTLFLARDRFGEKPLYYWQDSSELVFSSELGSLVRYARVPRRLHRCAVPYYLAHGFVPSPWTLFAGIHQLPAGHWMRWQAGQLTVRKYFEWTAQPDERLDEESAAELVRDALLHAVDRQRVSDVPVGAFLSGGIDSSSIVAALARQSSKPVLTFTARFENAQYDESPIARKVAEHLGTCHHEFVIPNRGFCDDDLWRVIRHVGQPFGDSSAIPTYYISRQIRDQVKVCLSGDGGDEMFAGYDFFVDSLRVDRWAAWAPRSAFRVLARTAAAASDWPGLRYSSPVRQFRQACELGAAPFARRFQRMAPLFDQRETKELLGDAFCDQSATSSVDPLDLFSGPGIPTRLRQLMRYRIGHSLSENMLVKVDRMSMAASLETRAPMLDVELSDVASRMPDRMLIRNGTTKYILRKAIRPWLPDEVFDHPKWGFAIPLHDYQNERYESLCHDLILPSQKGLVDQVFRAEALRKILDRGLSRKRDGADVSLFRASHQVWLLLQFAAWANHFNVSLHD